MGEPHDRNSQRGASQEDGHAAAHCLVARRLTVGLKPFTFLETKHRHTPLVSSGRLSVPKRSTCSGQPQASASATDMAGSGPLHGLHTSSLHCRLCLGAPLTHALCVPLRSRWPKMATPPGASSSSSCDQQSADRGSFSAPNHCRWVAFHNVPEAHFVLFR